MSLLTWKSEYAIGILRIDEQHRHLVAILNQLHAVMKNGSRKAEVRAVLEELVTYTRFHFASEEKLMHEACYPGVEDHVRKHRAMEARVGEFVREMATNSVTTPPRLLTFLKEWLARHIMETDREMARHCSKALASG
jgi:hemerythrin-like metal-binding protein